MGGSEVDADNQPKPLSTIGGRLPSGPLSPRLPGVDAHPSSVPFLTRLWLACACFFRIVFDGAFAARVLALLSPGGASDRAPAAAVPARAADTSETSTDSSDAALQLLALMQREGRLLDFLQQDVTAFGDAEIGAAARVVHDGCRKALGAHLELEPVRGEAEGTRVTLDTVDPNSIKLVGNVSGSTPFHGTLRHRGWRALSVRLPKAVEGHDPRVLAPAEVEL